ncbi:MAG: S8 family serine peptidase [Chloroflexi bacterium]|nr:S8 family serine peptidase [Chloroflexota bacterium]
MPLEPKLIVGRSDFQRLYVLLEDLYFIEFNLDVPEELIDSYLQENELEPYNPPGWAEQMPEERAAWYRPRRWVRANAGQNMDDLATDIVRRIAPVYMDEIQGQWSQAAPLPDVLLVETRPEDAAMVREALRQKYDLEEVEGMSHLLGEFLYFLLPKSVGAAYDILVEVAEAAGVTWVEFEWVMWQADAFEPRDALWAEQWNMVRVGAGGVGLTGWDLEIGSPNVTIAIIDSGCDLTHPDLAYTPENTHFNASQAANGVLGGPYDASPVRAHGTAVAGIAAALHNNLGVAGMAGGCSILPIYHGESSVGAAASMDWALAQGARVINMSNKFPPTASLHTAVQQANQAGILIVAAAGNNNVADVVFPAGFPETLAVGAMNQQDERRTLQSGSWLDWGSNWGTALDMMAPGESIPTTDLQANAGGFRLDFGRTSAAAPHATGLAALIFSRFPHLNGQQVREAISSTCEKIQPNLYVYNHNHIRPYGQWHDEVGYGLINVQQALDYAAGLP